MVLRNVTNLCLCLYSSNHKTWPEPSRLPVSPLVVRHHVSSLPQRQQGKVPHPQEVSRSRIVTGQEQSPSVRSGDTRKAQSCSSGNYHSSAWCVKSLRTSRQSWGFRVQPLVLFRWLHCLFATSSDLRDATFQNLKNSWKEFRGKKSSNSDKK